VGIISLKKKIFFSALIFFIFVGTLEGLAHIIETWYPTALVDFDGGFTNKNPIFIKDEVLPELRKTSPEKLAAFQDQHFLAKKKKQVFRIIFLG
jgi:hypothetical protein